MLPIVNEADRTVTLVGADNALKLTATRLSAVVGVDEYGTPFSAWAEMTRLHKGNFQGNMFLTAGKILEPKIIDYLKSLDPGYRTIKEIHGKQIRDAFTNDPIIGGIPDLYHVDAQERIDWVTEIKTTSNLAKWQPRPPTKYIVQNSVYSVEHGLSRGEIVCMYVGDVDITDIEELYYLQPNKSSVFRWPYEISKEMPEIYTYLEQGREFYTKYVLGGCSPPWDVLRDYSVVYSIKEYMKTFGKEELQTAVERLNYLVHRKARIDVLASEYDKEISQLKKQLKPSFQQGLIPASWGDLRFSLTPTSKPTYNTDAMKEDGVFEKYVKATSSVAFKVELSGERLNPEPVRGIFLTDGEIRSGYINKYNHSLSAGLYASLDGPYLLLESNTYVLAYVDTGSTAKTLVSDTPFGIQTFQRCVVFRRDLSTISEAELENIFVEFQALGTAVVGAELTSEF